MIIQGPLGVDGSLWDDHARFDEFIEAGGATVVMGLYKRWNGFKYILHPNCERICEQVRVTPLILQTFFYYYPQYDPVREANWYVDTIFNYNLPVAFSWSDCEDHGAVMDVNVRSERYRMFTEAVYKRFPKHGIYTNKNFIISYAPQMDKWIGKYKQWVPHYGRQPRTKIMIEWDEFKRTWLPNYNIILSAAQTPQNVVGHQFSGDRFYLPCFYNAFDGVPGWPYGGRLPVDVNVFTPEFIQSIGGNYVPPVPPIPEPLPVGVDEYIVRPNAINIRTQPINIPETWKRYAYHGEVLKVRIVEPDRHVALTNGYAQLEDMSWAYFSYLDKKV